MRVIPELAPTRVGVPKPEIRAPGLLVEALDEMRRDSSVETKIEIAAAPTGRLKGKGVLEILPTVERPSKVEWLSVRLPKVEFEPVPGADQREYQALENELECAAAAVRFEQGVLAEQLLHINASPVGANLLRTLFAQLQLVPGATGGVHQLTDATGTYESVYERLPTGGIRKTKRRSTRVPTHARGLRRLLQSPGTLRYNRPVLHRSRGMDFRRRYRAFQPLRRGNSAWR